MQMMLICWQKTIDNIVEEVQIVEVIGVASSRESVPLSSWKGEVQNLTPLLPKEQKYNVDDFSEYSV